MTAALQRAIAALETASEGSRELDVLIVAAVGWSQIETGPYLDGFSASIDAALTLVPEGCPFALRRLPSGVYSMLIADKDTAGLSTFSNAATAPLALCLAALRARVAMAEKDG